MQRKFRVLAAAAVLAAAPAAAQDGEFVRFLERTNAEVPAPDAAEMAPVALALLQQLHREMERCVPTGVRMDAARPMTATRHMVEMIRAGEVRNGWTAYGRLDGCDEARPLLFIVLRPASGPLIVVPVTFGETIANPTLILDSRGPATMAAGAMARQLVPGCPESGQAALDGMRVVSRSDDLGPDVYGVRYRGTWREAWTFSACGRRVELPITFTADGESGAGYSIHASEARLVE